MLLRVHDIGEGMHPDERSYTVDKADGTTVQAFAWKFQFTDGAVDIGYPVGSRPDGALLVQLPHEAVDGAWRVWVPAASVVSQSAPA